MADLVERIGTLEQVGDLYLKSYKPGEIARKLNISAAQAKHYINQYQSLVQQKVQNDPDFMDRVADNTIEALERLDKIVVEAWETYETAKDNEMVNQQINLLKVAATLEQQRANLLQLMGAKMDGGMMAKMQRAEKVNSIVSHIIKDSISQCEKCKLEAMPRLAEAFRLMNEAEEVVDFEDVEEVEVIEDEVEEHDHAAMMSEVIAHD